MKNIRNIAIIAHVDHGKTTLVDALLRQGGTFRENQEVRDRVMDSNDIEKERGITILSKNTAIEYKDYKINVVDTPGHADFSGEVERILKMVNGVVLVVDAFEGPMPQTRFVLKKALELNHKVIICINKVDREGARPKEVVDEVLELFLELDANDEQLDSPVIFASAKAGIATDDLEVSGENMEPLFKKIIEYIDAPTGDENEPLSMLVSTLAFNDYVGKIGIGRIENGVLKVGNEVSICNMHSDKNAKFRITQIFTFKGLDRIPTQEAYAGDIVAIAGVDLKIGDTLCDPDFIKPIEFQKISEPTISMMFMVNDSPFAGREGKFVTSRHLRERLFYELNTDVSLKVEETESTEIFKVSGRGELHLSVLIENMRREGYEFAVSKAEVIYKEIDGVKCEPIEEAVIDVPEELAGNVISKLSERKGELINIIASENKITQRLVFKIPSRGLIGYRNEFLTDTKGQGIMNTMFDKYEPYKGDIAYRKQGSLIAFETGEAVTYGLYNAGLRGTLFIKPGDKVYIGMVIGENAKQEDVEVNVCKKKQLTNMRASGSDDALRLSPPKILSLEQALEFIETDELLEITPENLRIRKKILDSTMRMRAKRNSNNN